MSLSEHEQQALREIERSLLQDDPKFGSSVAEDSGFGGNGGAITLRGIALIVVGLLLLVGGVAPRAAEPLVRQHFYRRIPCYVCLWRVDAAWAQGEGAVLLGCSR